MRTDHKHILYVFGNYLLLVGLLGLGGYLYVTYPDNEALGGMVLGLTGVKERVPETDHGSTHNLIGLCITGEKKENSQ